MLLLATFAPLAGAEHAPPSERTTTFYFQADASMRTAPEAGPSRVAFEHERQPQRFTSPPLEEDLLVALGASLRVHLADRVALASGEFVTSARVLVEGGAAPVVLAQAEFASRRDAAGDLLGTSAARELAENAPVASALRTIEPVERSVRNWTRDPAEGAHRFAFGFLCPGGWQDKGGNKVLCEQTYGNYGMGTIRPCRAYGTYGAAAGLLQETGACGPRSAANATAEAARAVDAHAGDAPLPEDRLVPRAGPDGGWRVLDLEVAENPHLPSASGAIVVPAGRRLVVEVAIRGDAPAWPSLDATYDGAVKPVAMDALAATGSAGHVQTPRVGPVPPFSWNATDAARSTLESLSFAGLDGVGRAPLPSAAFRFGGDSGSRLEVRGLVTPPEERTVLHAGFDAGDAPGWSLAGLWRVGDDCLGAWSPAHSLQFNRAGACDYNVTDAEGAPARARGEARVAVDLTGAGWSATLGFAHRFHVEPAAGLYDVMRVSVECGGRHVPLDGWDSRWPSPTGWTHERHDLGACLGQHATVVFSFDSVDAISNHHGGWAVDDVLVRAA